MPPFDVRVRVQGLPELLSRLRQSPEVVRDEAGRAMGSALKLTQAKIQSLVPRRTGNLQRSFSSRTEWNGDDLKGIVGTNVKYAPWVDQGTGLYGPRKQRIYPRRAKFLAWVTSGDRPTSPAGWAQARAQGRAVYARSVRGQLGQQFMLRGFQEAEPEIVKIFAGALQRVARRLAKG